MRKTALIVFALLLVAVIGYAGLHAAGYNAPKKTAVSQKSIAAKLRQKTATANTINPAPAPKTSPPTKMAEVTSKNNALPNTGPGNFIEIVALSTIGGALISYMLQLIGIYRKRST